MSTNEQDDEGICVEQDTYETLMDAYRQVNSESWIPVRRSDKMQQIEARPVDRQGDRVEGARIVSDRWLLREENGETYTVSDDVFEEKYEMVRSLRTERFRVDLSWHGTVEGAEGQPPDKVELEGWNVVAEVVAVIDVKKQMVTQFTVVNVSLAQDNWRNMDGIPVEILHDSPQFTVVDDDDTLEEQNDADN